MTQAGSPREAAVFLYGSEGASDHPTQDAPLPGEGASFLALCKLGLSVPPGFTLTSPRDALKSSDGELTSALRERAEAGLRHIEAVMGATFAAPTTSLLLSVRSGASRLKPGVVGSILNVGLNFDSVEALAAKTKDPRFAWDSFRRLIQLYGDVVLGVHTFYFEEELHSLKIEAGVAEDNELSESHLRSLVDRYLALIAQRAERPFPLDPWEQLEGAICAAMKYRWTQGRGTELLSNESSDFDSAACNVQAMVFGNRGERSGAGVATTRDPHTGARRFYGLFLPRAQGGDIRTSHMPHARLSGPSPECFEVTYPQAYEELEQARRLLERLHGDMLQIEFTLEDDRLWILRASPAERSSKAAIRVAVDLAEEGVLSREEAILLVKPEQLEELLHPTLPADVQREVIAEGLGASPGAASGRLAFSAAEAIDRSEGGERVILVRPETTPEDIRGMTAAVAILTARGGMTSHAAVVARQMGRPCIVGCHSLEIDEAARTLRIDGRVWGSDDALTLDGSRGQILEGALETKLPELTEAYHTLMSWADELRNVEVRANVDSGEDAALARKLGATGVGLARTEHMFFGKNRIIAMRQLILAQDAASRNAALDKLEPVQRADFVALLEAMHGMPVTIRLLDAPLHEFLPLQHQELAKVAASLGINADELKRRVDYLIESNPMLGHRGCRLGISAPEIYRMQVRALAHALNEAHKRGVEVYPQIMIPLVSAERELAVLRSSIERELCEHLDPALSSPLIGTMIELPRACLTADKIATYADFFSFGTNDLTQTVYGISRDDASHFLPGYIADSLYPADPFVSLDSEGVGELIELAISRARSVKPDLEIGVCGEHGGDPASVAWLQRGGRVHYLSCSPWRVPIARLSAAQAAIHDSQTPPL